MFMIFSTKTKNKLLFHTSQNKNCHTKKTQVKKYFKKKPT